MRKSIYSILLIAIFTLLNAGCQSGPDEVEFIRITDQGIAMFQVNNLTDQDYNKMDFEITYMNDRDEVILIDTLHYEMAEESANQIFLEAGGQSMISQIVPENTVTATGRILSVVNQ